nr:hypothetical protein [Tanacetum cinerariifolium]
AGVGLAGGVEGVAVAGVQNISPLRALQRHAQRKLLVAEGIEQAVGEIGKRVADDADVVRVNLAVAVDVFEFQVAGRYRAGRPFGAGIH